MENKISSTDDGHILLQTGSLGNGSPPFLKKKYNESLSICRVYKGEAMARNVNKNNFDQLAAGISKEERKAMLKQLHGSGTEGELFASKREYREDDYKLALDQEFRNQSWLAKLFIWISSLLNHKSAVEVLNNRMLKKLAREIESETPSLIIYSRKVAFTVLYEKVGELRAVAKFFRPYLQGFAKKQDEFYFTAGHIAMPEIEELIEEEINPYQFDINKPMPADGKRMLQDKLQTRLASLPTSALERLFAYVQGLNWLYHFACMPFESLLHKFSDTAGNRECLFPLIREDFERLARVMVSYVPLDAELMEVFPLMEKADEQDSGSDFDTDIEEELDFNKKATEQLPIIEMFVRTVPSEKLCRVINANALYKVEGIDTDADWFRKYADKWKRVLDQKLRQWNSDYQKQQLKNKLRLYFDMPTFPPFPYRPWTVAWNGLPFRHELSLGLINAFTQQYGMYYGELFKIILLEGEFSAKENRHEFNEAIDNFNRVLSLLEVLRSQLMPNGEYAVEFEKYRGVRTKSPAAMQEINGIMDSLDIAAIDIEKEFGQMCLRMENLLGGFLSDRRTGHYCSLLNIHRLHNQEYDFFVAVQDCHKHIHLVYEIIKELEPLERSTSIDSEL